MRTRHRDRCTVDRVINRYPIAEPAALPPGTMLDSAFVLIWMRNKAHP